MTRKVNQVLWQQWQERLGRQRASGLSIAEFCRQEGVSAGAFYTWKRRLRGEAVQELVPAGKTVAGRRTAGASASPTPGRSQRSSHVAATGDPGGGSFLQLPVLGARSGPWIELTLVDGTIVRIPQQNLAALQTVFTILRAGTVPGMLGEVSHA